MPKKLFRLTNIIITITLYAVLLIMLYTFISAKVNSQQPNLFGYQVFTVLSGSMEPGIKEGSIIVVNVSEERNDIHENDVITFVTEERVAVTHRVVDVQDNGVRFITKGDANDGVDLHPVHINNVIGKYVGITIPYIGYVLHYATTKTGAALLFIIPGIIILAHAILISFRAVHQRKRTNEEAN